MAHAIELINDGSRYLSEAGIENATFETELFLANILECQRLDIYLDNVDIEKESLNGFWQTLELRAKGMPLQYILRSCEFMGLEFKVVPGIFVPRPETEILVGALLEENLRPLYDKGAIVDIGTGSGAIAVSLGHYLKNTHIFACDICDYALKLAEENARKHGVNICFKKSDLLDAFDERQMFSLIVSNPPYISTPELSVLPREVRHEPRQALDAGPDGLTYYRRIIFESAARLSAGGILALEIGDFQAPQVLKLLEASGRFHNTNVVQDYNSKDRVIISQKKRING